MVSGKEMVFVFAGRRDDESSLRLRDVSYIEQGGGWVGQSIGGEYSNSKTVFVPLAAPQEVWVSIPSTPEDLQL